MNLSGYLAQDLKDTCVNFEKERERKRWQLRR